MTAKELQRAILKRRARVARELDKAARKTALKGYEKAIKLSSGTFVAKGEYAARNPRPPQDPAILNVGQGDSDGLHLRDMWVVRKTPTGYMLENLSPQAQYMDGTKFMMRRPLIERVKAYLEPIHRRNVSDALRRALK